MKYSRFERLIIGLGAVSILGTLAVAMQDGGPGAIEFLAQLLLLGVLVAAVHWGRRGGLVAALAASLVYIALRIPVLSEGLGFESLMFVITRVAAYGLVGIVGGEVCSRIKYVFARLDDSNTIDDWSRVYNQRHAASAIDHARERYARYGEPSSILVIELSTSLTAELRPQRQRTLIRAVANYLRGDVRMIDEVSRLDDGRFVVLLPHTKKEGGIVVEERLAVGVRRALGARDESVKTECLSAAEDVSALAALSAELSGEYGAPEYPLQASPVQ